MARKSPSTKDYGGYCYDRGRRLRTKLGVGSTISMRCDECKTLRYVAPLEMRRTAQPRCLRCGGHLNMCNSEAKRTRHERKPVYRPVGVKCKVCGSKFTDAGMLADHLAKPESSCRSEYCREHYVKHRPNVGIYLEGTIVLYRSHKCYKRWSLRAVKPDGSCLIMFTSNNRCECFDEMAKYDSQFDPHDLFQREE